MSQPRPIGVSMVLALFAGALSCSSSGSPPSSSSTMSVSAADCGSGTKYASQLESYSPGMQQMGGSNVVNFVLASALPAPPGTYNNTWVLKLLDAQGQPITDATVGVTTWMPLHSHPSSVEPVVTSNGDGTYSIALYLFMSGLWEITVNAQTSATSATATTDSTMFTFCVGG